MPLKFGVFGIDVSLDPDWIPVWREWWQKRQADDALNYSATFATTNYPDEVVNLISIRLKTELLEAPYTLLIDYTADPTLTLGTFVNKGRFYLPGELAVLREQQIERRRAAGKLKKGDQPALRVADVSKTEKGIVYLVEEATYYDQVGSNLSLDATLPVGIGVVPATTGSARAWDIAQSGSGKHLPSLSASRLSNTLGVAVGIRATDRSGRVGVIARRRGPNVDVYPNMWHVPFSFALSFMPPLPKQGELASLVNFDYAKELAEETKLEYGEITSVYPVALCRDLVRGGKPQLFFEMTTSLNFEELKLRLTHAGGDEFNGPLELIELDRKPELAGGPLSPELLAHIVLSAARCAASQETP